LQDPQQHDHLQQTLIEPLAQAQRQQRQSRQQQAAESKVEFFTLVRGES
jgi:alpha-D-ribose 1-methylphosphonate 5-triphosphate synthase subunit PhnG